jgi:hypothetical protein
LRQRTGLEAGEMHHGFEPVFALVGQHATLGDSVGPEPEFRKAVSGQLARF